MDGPVTTFKQETNDTLDRINVGALMWRFFQSKNHNYISGRSGEGLEPDFPADWKHDYDARKPFRA